MADHHPEIAGRWIASNAVSFVRTLRLWDSGTAGYVVFSGAPVYTLIDDDGDVVFTATPAIVSPEGSAGTENTGLYVESDDPPTLTPGRRYRERWSGLVAASMPVPDVVIDVYVTDATMDFTFTQADVVREAPGLLAYAPDATRGWYPQMEAARDELLARLVAEGWPGDLWSAYMLRNPMLHLSVAKCLWVAAAGAAGPIAELAAIYEARAERAWSRLRLLWDTDGDGDPDSTAGGASAPSGAPAPVM